MNAIFDINRFLKLEKRNFLTHKNQFLYASLILIGYFTFSVLLSLLIGIGQFMMFLIYPLAFAVVICAPCFFEKNIQKNNSIFDFILPSSTFEKFIVMIINYVIILPILCFGLIFLLVQLMSIFPHEILNTLAVHLALGDKISWESIYKMLMTQSVFMTGYFYFKRFSFVKTILIIGAIGIVLMITYLIASLFVLHDSYTSGNMGMFDGNINIEDRFKGALKIPTIITGIIFPFGLWVVSFLKLREKEI